MKNSKIKSKFCADFRLLVLFLLGAFSYFLIEILYRGYSHWSMALVAGGCVFTFFLCEDFFFGSPSHIAAIYAALLILLYEFSVGIIDNIIFKWQVWDYSDMAFNVLGQVCLPFFLIWYLLCFVFFYLINFLSSISKK